MKSYTVVISERRHHDQEKKIQESVVQHWERFEIAWNRETNPPSKPRPEGSVMDMPASSPDGQLAKWLLIGFACSYGWSMACVRWVEAQVSAGSLAQDNPSDARSLPG